MAQNDIDVYVWLGTAWTNRLPVETDEHLSLSVMWQEDRWATLLHCAEGKPRATMRKLASVAF